MKWFLRLFFTRTNTRRVEERRSAFKVVKDTNKETFDAMATYDQRLNAILSNLKERRKDVY